MLHLSSHSDMTVQFSDAFHEKSDVWHLSPVTFISKFAQDGFWS